MAKWKDYEAVWGNSQASGNDLLLLLTLVKFRQDEGMYATKETLAQFMRCNVDTVDRCLKRLKALGELDWDRGSSHSRKANLYRIYLPGLDENTPLNSPRNSQEIPPETHGEHPRNITPLNIKEIENKEALMVFDSNPDSPFGKHVWLKRPDLSKLQVWEWLQAFERDKAWRIQNVHTEKIVTEVLAYIPRAEGDR
jgi:hypothetical protein